MSKNLFEADIDRQSDELEVENSQRILFLDIDGVLNTSQSGGDFDTEAVSNLSKIIEEANAEIVLSSSWKFLGLDEIQEMWKERNLPGKVMGVTPNSISDEMLLNANLDDMDSLCFKGLEIKEWLSKHGESVKNYVIIDDENSFLPEQQIHIVLTNPKCGISKNDAERAIRLLSKADLSDIKKELEKYIGRSVSDSLFSACLDAYVSSRHGPVGLGGYASLGYIRAFQNRLKDDFDSRIYSFFCGKNDFSEHIRRQLCPFAINLEFLPRVIDIAYFDAYRSEPYYEYCEWWYEEFIYYFMTVGFSDEEIAEIIKKHIVPVKLVKSCGKKSSFAPKVIAQKILSDMHNSD